MSNFLESFAGTSDFLPHGYCLVWEPGLVWMHVGSDVLTGLSYYLIAAALCYLVIKRRDLPFFWMFFLFGAFIFACGTTHLMAAWTIYVPSYWLEGAIKTGTAALSVATALLLVPLLPRLLNLPNLSRTLADNRQLNQELNVQVDNLREKEEKYRSLIETTGTGYVIIDDQGHVIDANQEYVKLTGRRHLADVVGHSVLEWTAPYDLERNAIEVGKCVDQGFVRNLEIDYVTPSGQIIPIELNATVLHTAGTFQILTLCRDITERKKTENEQEKLQEQFRQAQKMESVGRLAGGVAHDFNNMMGVILGQAEMAMNQVDATQPLHASLAEIHKAARRSADLTRQLLAFARKQTIAPKVLDLNETVAGMLNMLQRLIGEDIQLNWQPKANLWPVRVDPSQIDQILANLCVNARDAIVDVGKISIETGNSTFDEDDCATQPEFVPGEYVRLMVSDTGHGMDQATLAHIFEPFFTTKGVGKGTGLGLATVYGVVKQNNGFINVYSEPGKGTRFAIYLPRHAGPAEQARVASCSAGPTQRGQETILLVEDEPAILDMTTRMLAGMGYTIIAANTPGEAIRLAREHAGEINLLMTDVVMPEMNGRDLAKNLLSLYPDLKRLYMSGYTADVIAHRGVLDEGVHFIQKPFSIKALSAKVREALEYRG